MHTETINKANFKEVQRIYQEGLDTGIATFETTVPNWEYWNDNHQTFGRIIAKNDTNYLGWAALSPASKRQVYSGVAEVSVYVSEEFRGQGIGKFLLDNLIKISEKNNIWTLQAGIMRANKSSIKMHQNCGFRIVGYKEKIGQLNTIWLDNIILERRSQITGQ